MSTQQRDLPPNYPPAARRAPAKPSAIARRDTLERQRGPIERYSAIFILLVGVVGTVVAFHGGWEPVLSLHLSLAATLGGIGVQAVLTFLEWWYYDRKWISWTARLIDARLTYVGYSYLVLPALSHQLITRGNMQPQGAEWFAAGTLAVISFMVAWFPENRLIGD